MIILVNYIQNGIQGHTEYWSSGDQLYAQM